MFERPGMRRPADVSRWKRARFFSALPSHLPALATILACVAFASPAATGEQASSETASRTSAEPVPRAEAQGDAPERLGLTGNWGGLRQRLHGAGVHVVGGYIVDLSAIRADGVALGDAARGLIQLGAAFDLQRMVGLRGGTFFAGFHSFGGRSGVEVARDVQGYSNIDADEFVDVAEVWYEQRMARDRVRLKIGRVDANTEFAFVGAAGAFINSSAGFSPTILTLPTYPQAMPGVNLAVRTSRRSDVRVGVYRSTLDGDPLNRDSTALFAIGESAAVWRGRGAWGPGRAVVGAWHDSAILPRLASDDGRGAGIESGTMGWYAVLEQQLRLGSGRNAGPNVLSLFSQIGAADAAVSPVVGHVSLGAAYGPLVAERGDALGVMLARVALSEEDSASTLRHELVVELFYHAPITRYLFLRPDLQYISTTSSDSGSRDLLAATLRIGIAF